MPTFRTVRFNRTGLSLVVAEQKSEKSSPTMTYNGVGKTLMLELLHYCLGSNRKPAFERYLKGWEFSLAVEVAGVEHLISRRADKPSDINLDGQEINLSKLRHFFEGVCLETGIASPMTTFRSLIRKFIRSGRSAYVDFSYGDIDESKDAFRAMLSTAFLLGLDLGLAIEKFQLRNRKQKLKTTMKELEQDPLFAKLLAQDAVDIELIALREEAAKLQKNLSSFRVADDYHQIEKQANRIKRRLDSFRREEIKLTEAIAQIDRSMRTKGDLSPDRVFRIYQEAQAALPEMVQRRIEEVRAFQQDLQRKRIYRLSRDRQRLDSERREQEGRVRSLSDDLDKKMKYLSEHRALDEYIAVNNELSEIQRNAARLEESKALRNTVDGELKRIDLELAKENIQTDEYLQKSSALIAEATSRFRSFARELYGSRPSGLSIGNDAGENQLRYRIDAHIKADAAEGINEAKIYCFDMTTLSLRRGHNIEFLAHDSTLFGPIDPRQRLAMFRIAHRMCEELDIQYIATLNLHDITSIREQVLIDEAEMEKIFGSQSVVLRLTDGSAESKLLGIDVDMDYTE